MCEKLMCFFLQKFRVRVLGNVLRAHNKAVPLAYVRKCFAFDSTPQRDAFLGDTIALAAGSDNTVDVASSTRLLNEYVANS